jgi:hypothetical protein
MLTSPSYVPKSLSYVSSPRRGSKETATNFDSYTSPSTDHPTRIASFVLIFARVNETNRRFAGPPGTSGPSPETLGRQARQVGKNRSRDRHVSISGAAPGSLGNDFKTFRDGY